MSKDPFKSMLDEALGAVEGSSKSWRKNEHGFKDSIDTYRTFGGEHYANWTFGYCEEVLDRVCAFFRKNGVKCRRLGEEVFVRKSDHAKAGELQSKFPEECDPERVWDVMFGSKGPGA